MEKNVELLELIGQCNIPDLIYSADSNGKYVQDETFGEYTEVFSIGGHEGGGEYVEVILYFKAYDAYVKFEGYYSSYEGTDWSDCDFEQVKPILKAFKVFTTNLDEDETDLNPNEKYYYGIK